MGVLSVTKGEMVRACFNDSGGATSFDSLYSVYVERECKWCICWFEESGAGEPRVYGDMTRTPHLVRSAN